MKVTFNRKKNEFILKTKTVFPEFVYNNIAFVKQIKQIRKNKITIPKTENNTEILKTLTGFEWSDLAFNSLYSVVKTNNIKQSNSLNHDLFAFQEEGVAFFFTNKGRGVCCDEMGLGKTIQTLAWCAEQKNKLKIIICPSSVKYNWEKEINYWLKNEKNVFIMNGRKPETIPYGTNYIIINYDILLHRYEEILKVNPNIIVIDEFHYIKKNTTKRTKIVKIICKGRNHIIGLSGTPITSRPLEFFNMLNIINPIMFPSYWQYVQKYCGAKHNGFGWDFSGATNTEELHLLVKDKIMIRRKKKDVLKDLPDKIRTIIPLDITNRKTYNKAKRDFLYYLLTEKKDFEKAESASKAEGLTKMAYLRKLIINGKMKYVLEWLDDFLEDNVDDKIVVFTLHRETLHQIFDKYKDIAVKIEGATSAIDRKKAVEKFQTDKNIRMFIGNIKSAGTGITLTASSSVCHVELDWLPTEHLQATDRCHRIGQKDTVNEYYLIAKDTIEEDIMELLSEKMDILNQVIDGKDVKDTNLFRELLERIGREKNERKK